MWMFEGVLRFARTGSGDVTTLHGDMAGAFRLRLGEYRVLFTLEDNGDFTAYIKTYAGTYVSWKDPNHVATVLNVDEATRWRFYVVGF